MMASENSDDRHDLEETLRMLRPKPSELDVSSVFYQAGFQAAVARQPKTHIRSLTYFASGLVFAAAIIAPVSYRTGLSKAQTETKPGLPAQQVAQSPTKVPEEVIDTEQFDPVELVDANVQQSENRSRLAELISGRWFSTGSENGPTQSTTLAAFHARSFTDSDQDWLDFPLGFENRYRTFAANPGSLNNKKTLAISDTVELAESLGDF